MGVAGEEVVDLGGQVDRPVDEPVEELVEPEQDRRDGEADAQQHERLEGGVVESAAGGRRCGAVGWTLIVVIRNLLLKVSHLDDRTVPLVSSRSFCFRMAAMDDEPDSSSRSAASPRSTSRSRQAAVPAAGRARRSDPRRGRRGARPRPDRWPRSTSTSWSTPGSPRCASSGSPGAAGPGAGRPAKLYRRADDEVARRRSPSAATTSPARCSPRPSTSAARPVRRSPARCAGRGHERRAAIGEAAAPPRPAIRPRAERRDAVVGGARAPRLRTSSAGRRDRARQLSVPRARRGAPRPGVRHEPRPALRGHRRAPTAPTSSRPASPLNRATAACA